MLLAVARKRAQDYQVDCVGAAHANGQIHIWQGNGRQLFLHRPWTSPELRARLDVMTGEQGLQRSHPLGDERHNNP